MMIALFRALRPTHWVKNGFVLAPLVFAQKLGDLEALTRSGLAFLAFCAAASAIYLFNDLNDREDDRHHPVKCRRPIASGALPVGVAVAVTGILALVAFALSFGLGARFIGLVAFYLGLNLLYSTGLKRWVILDLMVVAAGYVIRVEAGASAIQVALSSWLLLCTIFLALFLILSKRRHEVVLLAEGASGHRAVLSQYSLAFLDQMINVVTASTVVAYALYCVDPTTIVRFGSSNLVYSIPLVLFGIFRYLYLIYQQTDQRNPTEVVLTDGPSLINLVLWGLLVLWIVYG